MNEFDQELKKRISHIEEILDHYLPKPEGFQKTVLKAMNTTVKAGGKRRSEERRVGKECCPRCRSRWSPDH